MIAPNFFVVLIKNGVCQRLCALKNKNARREGPIPSELNYRTDLIKICLLSRVIKVQQLLLILMFADRLYRCLGRR